MRWYLKVIKNYAGFSGRASRTEYWMFVLFNILFALLAMLLDNVLHTTFSGLYGVIYCIYALAVFIPGLAVTVRRLHDIGKSGWNFLWVLIPLVGGILLLVWLATDSKFGDNKYGTTSNQL